MSKDLGVTAEKQDAFSEWYTQTIVKAELIEYTDVSGCIVYRPASFAMWEAVQAFLDAEFKKLGVQNAYFPSLITESLLNKEASHIEGFAPEVAWVTHGGKSELSERLAIRPTSETVMYAAFSKWIRSHRDLPLLLNQWTNVVRWEFKHPTPFLRGREFLWQEGHTAHANKEDAEKEAQIILDIYKRCYEELLAVPVLSGRKSEKEKFAGADYSLSLEALFPNGKAIQACTSHHLGQNFSRAFDISFQDVSGKKEFAWQNSWGFTTRSLGVMIGVHGDDKGLVLPPRIAPIKVVVVPITFSKKPEVSAEVVSLAKKLCDENGWHLDDRDHHSPGYRFAEWELKGVPVRLEIGPRDLEKKVVVVSRRDQDGKEEIAVDNISSHVETLLEEIQSGLFLRAKQKLDSSVVDVSSLDQLKEVVSSGKLARAPWCGSEESEEEIKKVTGAKSLNMQGPTSDKCFVTGQKAQGVFVFGRSY